MEPTSLGTATRRRTARLTALIALTAALFAVLPHDAGAASDGAEPHRTSVAEVAER